MGPTFKAELTQFGTDEELLFEIEKLKLKHLKVEHDICFWGCEAPFDVKFAALIAHEAGVLNPEDVLFMPDVTAELGRFKGMGTEAQEAEVELIIECVKQFQGKYPSLFNWQLITPEFMEQMAKNIHSAHKNYSYSTN